MNFLTLLMAVDDELVDWILHASCKTKEQRIAMRAVFILRARLDESINRLVALRLKLPLLHISNEVQALNGLKTEIETTAKRVEEAQKVLTVTGNAIDLAAKVIGFATA